MNKTKTSLQLKTEILNYLETTASALWTQSLITADQGQFETSEALKQKAGTYENAATYIRHLETNL